MPTRTGKHRCRGQRAAAEAAGTLASASALIAFARTASVGTSRRWPPERATASSASARPLSFADGTEGS
jgi:hypothetical protein